MSAPVKKYNERWLHITLLIIAILIAYFKIFQAGYIAWDDAEYVLHNHDIRGFTYEYIAAWFSKFYVGNYHPFTICSYAIDYALGGLNPMVYHVTNLLLHGCNAILLYLFINRLQPNKPVAFFVALIFAIHPVQTESVSWIAERKTVLCAFFYLLALLKYTSYVKHPSGKQLLIVFLLGVAAMLSKGVGVALPLSLFAVDIWMQRDFKNSKIWLEKIPLLAVSVIIGIVAIKAQAAENFLNMHPENSALNDVVFAAYAYVQYIIHLVIPIRLSVIYPYPHDIGFAAFIYLFFAFDIMALAFYAYRKKWFIVSGGIVFYTVNIALVLQFIQFGETLMADRYLYIAGIGILFPVIYCLITGLEQIIKPVIATVICSVIALVFLTMTFFRNDIWLSDMNFYTAIVNTFPNSAVAQYSMGALYTKTGDYPRAESYINTAISLDPGNYKAWYDKGVLYHREGNTVAALDALNRCLAIKDYAKAYFSRALIYEGERQPDLALADIEHVLASQPENARAWYIKADCLEQKGSLEAAIDGFSKAISLDAGDPLFFIRRGIAYEATNRLQPALSDLNNAVALNPNNGEALYYRGMVKYRAGQDGCNDLRSALSHGYKPAQQAIAQFCR